MKYKLDNNLITPLLCYKVKVQFKNVIKVNKSKLSDGNFLCCIIHVSIVKIKI